jgi:arylsulfatase A-like enzyme
MTGAWFGLVTGLVEGVGLFALRQLADYQWNGPLIDVSPACLWISPLVDLMLFSTAGFLTYLIIAAFSRKAVLRMSILVYVFLLILDWLAIVLGGWLMPYALVLLTAGLALYAARLLLRRPNALTAFCRRSLPYGAGVVLVTFMATQTTVWWLEESATRQLTPRAGLPNVLILVADTLRADRLSCYGYHRPTSPNIDRLAGQGTRFTAAFSTSSLTAPSHASLLTGLYPSGHGVEWETCRSLLHRPVAVLPEVLLAYGYRTGAFSANTFWFTRPRGFGRGFLHFEDYYPTAWDMVLRTVYGRVLKKMVLPRLGFEDIPARKRASDTNAAFLAWVDRHPDLPFFAFLNYMEVHDPYLPPTPFRLRFAGSAEAGGLINWQMGRSQPQLTPEQVRSESDTYDGAVAYLDEQIGRLAEQLEARGLKNRTLVIFTSDHGESFGEHGLFAHGHSLYRETLHVPLIICRPGGNAPGVRADRVVSNAAIPATVMDVIGAQTENLFPGPSLLEALERLPVATEPEQGIGPFVVAELHRQPWASLAWPVRHGSMSSILTSRVHLIHHEARGEELYEWQADPAEVHDLIQTRHRAEEAAQARQILQQITGQTGTSSP